MPSLTPTPEGLYFAELCCKDIRDWLTQNKLTSLGQVNATILADLIARRWDHVAEQGKTAKGKARSRNAQATAFAALGTKTLGYSEWLRATDMSESTFRRKRKELIQGGKVEAIGDLYRAKPASPP
jgi:hypothetical protein